MAFLGGGQISCGLLPDVVATGAAISDKMGELVQNFVARPKGGVVVGTRGAMGSGTLAPIEFHRDSAV